MPAHPQRDRRPHGEDRDLPQRQQGVPGDLAGEQGAHRNRGHQDLDDRVCFSVTVLCAIAAPLNAPTANNTGSGNRVRTTSGAVIATLRANCSASDGAAPEGERANAG